MSEQIKHECGISMIRLLKPLDYYQSKYGTWQYGVNKLYLLMEKQHNRGQDGAGALGVKINMPPGKEYIFRQRSIDPNPMKDIFGNIYGAFNKAAEEYPQSFHDPVWAKENLPFAGEVYLGHLRYGTYGRNGLEFTHPVMRLNNWRSRNLALAGNFNLTNVDELFQLLVDLGQHPKGFNDTVTILEKFGHFIDEENELLFRQYKNEGLSNKKISHQIEKNIEIRKILERASRDFDGGYAITGVLGHGDAFVVRDPWGIRPAFYYADEEIVVVASERPVIQTVMNVSWKQVNEVKPGNALIIKVDGRVGEELIRIPQTRKSCSFERIYFSRGSDRDIYLERKKLGYLLAPTILKVVNNDLKNTVFSYIPNTAETAFLGMMEGIRENLLNENKAKIHALGVPMTEENIAEIISVQPRMEKIAIKDVKLRTFIADDSSRDDLVGHVYDVTYGIVANHQDTLVVIDDSIVRGTTLKKSIIKILDRLHPKKIVIISSAPQIRFPDCYGIDMSVLGKFIAFEAAITLLRETGRSDIIDEVYKKCKEQQFLPKEEIVNYVKDIYKPFSYEEISDKIGVLLKPEDCNAEVQIVYQTVENLHIACPNDLGDWYFTGDYPTPGGNKVVNTAFINYIEGIKDRAY